ALRNRELWLPVHLRRDAGLRSGARPAGPEPGRGGDHRPATDRAGRERDQSGGRGRRRGGRDRARGMKTEGARDAAATLVGLVATCRQGEHKFRAAAARITDPTLRKLLECYAEQRAAFAAELQQAIARTGKAQAISGAPHPAPGEGEP